MSATTVGEDRLLMFEDHPISVLVVDDNERWAEYVSEALERQNERLAVTVATSATEALDTLDGSEGFECIVTDYRMPELSGIELLSRIRDQGRDVPLILLTGQGNESLAAEAIRAGASDYVVKDPSTDQTPLIEQRIRSAVRQHRLERGLRESEERYRTVTEQTRDAIMIVQDGAVAFANQRLVASVGNGDAELDGFDPVESLVYPDDRETIRSAIDTWYDGTDVDALQESRVVTSTDEVRHWEFAGQPITFQEAPAVLISARDVTERKRRKRELEWERELNRNVQEALVESQTREELEAAVCEQLRHYGYALAWTGRLLDDALHPEIVRATGDATVIEHPLSVDAAPDAPSVAAAQTGESRFVDDVSTLDRSEWREATLDAGYRSGAALPLAHEDVFYGVLAVYDDAPDRFDETERSLLSSLAETVGFAIHSLATRDALTADRAVELVLRLQDAQYYLIDVAHDPAFRDTGGQFIVEGTIPHDDSHVLQYVTVEEGSDDRFRDLATAHPAVETVSTVSETDARYEVLAEAPTPESRLAAVGTLVRETTVDRTGAELRVELATSQEARAVVDHLSESFPSTMIDSVVEIDRGVVSTQGVRAIAERDLTDKQAEALRAAYHQGYFENPRQSSATDVADSLGVAHSTFLQHLRAAQQKLFGQFYS